MKKVLLLLSLDTSLAVSAETLLFSYATTNNKLLKISYLDDVKEYKYSFGKKDRSLSWKP